ncbi:MAG: hypothetical protein WBA10_05225 [Elainellaceae cyanobacterium]
MILAIARGISPDMFNFDRSLLATAAMGGLGFSLVVAPFVFRFIASLRSGEFD